MDVASAYTEATRDHVPHAVICYDPFYAEVRIMPMWCGLLLVTAVTMPVRSA
jgi:hypothetical protein